MGKRIIIELESCDTQGALTTSIPLAFSSPDQWDRWHTRLSESLRTHPQWRNDLVRACRATIDTIGDISFEEDE